VTIEKKTKTTFDWLAAIIYPLAVVLMEAFWIYPWLSWVGSWPMWEDPRPALSLASVIILLAVALLLTRRIVRRDWPMQLVRAAVICGGLVVIFLVIRIEYGDGYGVFDMGWFGYTGKLLGNIGHQPSSLVPALPVALYLWWRGIRLGQTTSYFRDIYRTFILGLTALIVLIIIWQLSAGSERFTAPGAGMGWNVIAFFFFGLMAIAISHLYMMRSKMPKEEAASMSVRRWLPIMLGVIAGMVLVVFGIASLFSEQFFETVGHGAGTVFDALGKVFHYILIPLNYVFEAIFWVLRLILNALRNTPTPPSEQSGNVSQQPFPEVVPRELSPTMMLIIKWVIIALIIAAVIFILGRAISRLSHRREEEDIEEINESLGGWRNFRDDLKQFFGMMGQRFRRKGAPASRRTLSGDDDSRLDVREIYRHLQWEAARSGIARRRPETAQEYSRRLARQVPEGGENLAGLTDLYSDIRYGEKKPSEEKVDNANVIWRAVRGILRKTRGDQ
jgi:hypothetical protein